MKNMTMRMVARATGGIMHNEAQAVDREILGVAIDNREVVKDYVFIPIRGQKVDGHTFIPAAFRAGALFVLSDHELSPDEFGGGEEEYPYIEVKDTPTALKQIAKYYRSTLSIPIIGIVGSVGKTSTKEMVASVLSRKFGVLKTEGNYNNEIGLPLTLLRIREFHTAAVVEMGISDFGEMDRLGEIANPDIVVMTNIGQCHLEQLQDRDGVLKAKSEILRHLHIPATVILNGDDDKLSLIKEVVGARILRYGIKSGDIRATKVQPMGFESIRVAFVLPNGNVAQATIPLPGEHTVYNAMAAAAVGFALKMPLPAIIKGIESVRTIQGRSNFLHLRDNITVIDDCYNANPMSMKASLSVLAQAPGRKIAVLGDMGELGKDEKKLHFEIGTYMATLPIQWLLTAGELSLQIAQGIYAAGGRIRVRTFETRDAMSLALLRMIEANDTILLKASHFMQFDHVVEDIKNNYQ
ncbi:MAG: UDP-N-acetylmuramoyl-tripeptide--D-alanyl-D-alanine ligase [Lachnospiraceae bacterium]|nr:UDP-N-acetylmuramoyl-tripeptide--D-alanyl-D-alanine ligase [Lachnospiraceae bacterium]